MSNESSPGGVTLAIALGAFLVATVAVVIGAVHSPSAKAPVDAVSASAGLPAVAEVSLAEFSITPKTVTANEGLVQLKVTNKGTMAHNLSVPDLSKKTIDLGAGATATLDLGDVKAGTYKILCEVAGHADSGMTGSLVIGSGDMSGMTGMDHSASGSTDSTATTMNSAKMEKEMTAGVTSFLDYAKKYGAGKIKKGNELLAPKVLPDGTKQFHLTAAITDWEVSPGKVVKAWTYNGTVPGPKLQVDPGDKVEVVLKNDLPISTDIHMHGLDVPFEEDGVAPITQDYVEPGATYTYRFTADSHPKLGMYHAHMHGQVAIVNGLFAIFEIGHVALPVGQTVSDEAIPADLDPATIKVIPMVLNDAGVIGLSLNGKAFPETEPIVAKKGEWMRLDFFNEGLQVHPMHLHRQGQIVIAKDGYPLASPYRVDTLLIAPGERYSVLIHAEDVGTWAFHCHIVSHAENDSGLYGMVTAMIVQ